MQETVVVVVVILVVLVVCAHVLINLHNACLLHYTEELGPSFKSIYILMNGILPRQEAGKT